MNEFNSVEIVEENNLDSSEPYRDWELNRLTWKIHIFYLLSWENFLFRFSSRKLL